MVLHGFHQCFCEDFSSFELGATSKAPAAENKVDEKDPDQPKESQAVTWLLLCLVSCLTIQY